MDDVLFGRAGAALELPRKSKPKRESFCFGSCLSVSTFGGGALEKDGSVVFGRGSAAGSNSSPNRSTGAGTLFTRDD